MHITVNPQANPQVSLQLQRSPNGQFAKILSLVIPEYFHRGKGFVSLSFLTHVRINH